MEEKHGLRLVPLDQETLPAGARVGAWADLLAEALRFRTVPETLAAALPDLVAESARTVTNFGGTILTVQIGLFKFGCTVPVY